MMMALRLLMSLYILILCLNKSFGDKPATRYGNYGGDYGGGSGYGGVGGYNGGGGNLKCSYWCRNHRNQFYCCENNNYYNNQLQTKPGSCPTTRPYCPTIRQYSIPKTCSFDSSCLGANKCCYDIGLEVHVCKPPKYTLGGIVNGVLGAIGFGNQESYGYGK